MLMEPDEYTSQERALTDKAKELIEQHELDWGNGECFIQRDAGHRLHPGQSNAGQGNETIAEIRWTEEDLRHWLKDHDWPDNNENMDAMRDMISARELRDRSIEEGWEIIDAMVDDGRLARKDEGEKAETSETYDPANPADPLSIADTSASAAATR